MLVHVSKQTQVFIQGEKNAPPAHIQRKTNEFENVIYK